jgi:hypothetical protein
MVRQNIMVTETCRQEVLLFWSMYQKKAGERMPVLVAFYFSLLFHPGPQSMGW